MAKIMKATVRNGRATASGKVYNANHNTKAETRAQERHIDHERTDQNINLYVNGEYDNIRWPNSGNNPKIINIRHISAQIVDEE